MNRPLAGILVITFAALTAVAEGSIVLDIPPRRQWDNKNGYCGETAIQQAALCFGTYVSQYRARQIIDPTQGQDVWVPENSGPVFDTLRLTYTAWDSTKPTPQYQSYLAWAKTHLQQSHPVIIDVFVKGESDPAYDHIMLATGFTSVDSTTYHSADTLVFNDGYEPTPYTRTFGTLNDTRSMRGNGATYEYCIPTNTDYGCAVTGIADTSGTLLPVSLKLDRWDEPNVTKSVPASPATLTATIRVTSLTAGKSYALLRFDDPSKVPTTNYLTSRSDKATIFTATSASQTLSDQFLSNAVVIYRCVPQVTDPPPVARVERTASVTRVRFNTDTGKRYTVEWRNDLKTGTWSNLSAEVAGTGGEISVTDSSAAGQPKRFYRVKMVTP